MHYQTIRTRNDKYQIFKSYRTNRVKRRKNKKIFIEGVVPINIALENNIQVESILISDERKLSDWGQGVLQKTKPETVYRLCPELLSKVSGKENASELIVIADQPSRELHEIDFGALNRVLILDRPSNHGNLGAIIRSCDAFRVDSILIAGHAVDHYDPKTISSSRGTVFQVPIYNITANQDILARCEAMKEDWGYKIYGTSAHGNRELKDVTFEDKTCLIIGNEATGLSYFYHGISDEIIRIEVAGVATSLNVACATAILLYELSISQARV